MKLFLLAFTLFANLANAGTMTSGHFYWPEDDSIEASAYGIDKSVEMARVDAEKAIFSVFKVAKDKKPVSFCLEVLPDGTCTPNGPIVVVLPLIQK